MTYHPIDKPTEPGLYWFQGVVGRPHLCRVDAMMRVDGMMSEVGAYSGPPSHLSDMPGTWYGPKIDPPATDGPTQGTVR